MVYKYDIYLICVQKYRVALGATLGKGLNRGLATLLAGALGIGAHHLASLSGQIGEPILLASFVFLQGKNIKHFILTLLTYINS